MEEAKEGSFDVRRTGTLRERMSQSAGRTLIGHRVVTISKLWKKGEVEETDMAGRPSPGAPAPVLVREGSQAYRRPFQQQ